jgi:hypothetical protein
MTWSLRKGTAYAFVCQLIAILCVAVFLNGLGCVSRSKNAPPKQATVIPAAPAADGVIAGHKNRESVQFEAAERINVEVTGLSVEPVVREQTSVIVEANRVASADQIADLATAFGATVTAQATEIKRIGAENARLASDNADLVKKNAELQAKLDDFGRKVAVYTANGIGALLLLTAVAVGMLTKNLTYVGWCVAGSGLGFGTARVVGHWLFPWVIGVGAVLILAGGVIAFVIERKRAADKARQLAAADDVIAAVEEIRAFLKSPPVEIVESIRSADTTENALAALRGVGDRVKTILSSWVSELDGTAAVVDARRRALKLI